MYHKGLLSGLAALALVMSAVATSARAQSVTTGAIGGTILDQNGQPIEGAQIQVRNNKTGTTAGGLSRSTGQYIIQGIEPDFDYGITVRRIGYIPATRNHFRVTLSQTTAEDFTLLPQTNILSAVRVSGEADPIINPAHTGTNTTFDDSTLHRLPSLTRNFVDFVSTVPQVSTATGFLSAGAVNIRQNAIQIDGAGSGDFFGLGATGQPGSQANAKLIPLDAVKEFQILLSP